MQHQAAEQDVQRQVEAFARAILETPEHRAFMQASDDLQNDREASDLLQQYEHKKAELLEQVGLDTAALNELKAVHDRVRSNATLAAFHSTQSALATLLIQTNDRISEKIGQQFARGHHGGCHHGGHHHGGCC